MKDFSTGMKNDITVNLFCNLNLTIKVTRPHTPLPFGKSLIYITILGTKFTLVISVKQEADTTEC